MRHRHARRVLGRTGVAGVDLPRARGDREEGRAERRRPVEVRFLDVARADRLDAALGGAAAPAHVVALEARRRRRRSDSVLRRVERRSCSAGDVETSRARPAALPVVVSTARSWPRSRQRRRTRRDAVFPAVRQAAVHAEGGAREGAWTAAGDVRHDGLRTLTRDQAVERGAAVERRRGRRVVRQTPRGRSRGGRRPASRSRRSQSVDGRRGAPGSRPAAASVITTELTRSGMRPGARAARAPGRKPLLVGDQVVDADGRRREDERAVGRGAGPRQRRVAEVVEDDERAGDRAARGDARHRRSGGAAGAASAIPPAPKSSRSREKRGGARRAS